MNTTTSTTNGAPAWGIVCKCGYKGFAHEGEANRYVEGKKLVGEKHAKVRCPVGDTWHVTNVDIKGVDDFVSMVTRASKPTVTKGLESLKEIKLPVADAAPPPQEEPPPRFSAPRPQYRPPPEAEPTPVTTSETGRPPPKAPCVKISYGSEVLAKTMLQEAQAAGRDERTVYQCPNCGKWHLSSLSAAFDISQMDREELVSFRDNHQVTTVLANREKSTGKLLQVEIRSTTGVTIRFLPENANALRGALALALGRTGAPPKVAPSPRRAHSQGNDPVYDYVAEHPGCTVSDIATDINHSKWTIRNQLKALEKASRIRTTQPSEARRGRPTNYYEVVCREAAS